MPKKQDPDWTTKDPKGIFTSDESDDKKPAFSTPAPIAIAYDDGSHEHSDNDPGTDYTSASDECEETASDEAITSTQHTLLTDRAVPLSYGNLNKGPKKFVEHLASALVSVTVGDIAVFISNEHSRVQGEKVVAGGIEWHLVAKAVDSNGTKYLGCYLVGAGYAGWRRFVNARFSAQSGDGTELRSGTFDEPKLFHEDGALSWGWPRYVEKQKLLNAHNGNDGGNSITISAEFSVGTDIFAQANDIADVKFVFKNQAVYATRGYLKVISSVFANMFQGRCSEKDDAILEMPLEDCKLEQFLHFLAAIYPTRVPVGDANLQLLYIMANKYNVEELVRACEDHLLMTSTIACVEKLSLADSLHRAEFCDVLIAKAAPSDLMAIATGTLTLRPELHSKVLKKYLATKDVPPMDKILLVQDRGDQDLLIRLVKKLTLSGLQTIVTHEKKEQLSKDVLLKLLDHLCGLKTRRG